MTPIWIFPAYPLLLTAPFAANLIDALPSAAAASRINSLTIALAAICLQGTGFLVSLMVLSAFIYRLMTQKIPRETTRPGMVSPPTRILCIQPVYFQFYAMSYALLHGPTAQTPSNCTSSSPSARADSPSLASSTSATSCPPRSCQTGIWATPARASSSRFSQMFQVCGCGDCVSGSSSSASARTYI